MRCAILNISILFMPSSVLRPIRIAIVGCGFGGAYTYKRLHRTFRKSGNVQCILINPRNYFLFTPLLHEVATGGIAPENIVEPIRESLGCCADDFYLAHVERVNCKKKVITTTLGDIAYDYCVIATGSQTQYFGTPGAEQHTFSLKSLEDAMRLKNHCIRLFERVSKLRDASACQQLLRFVVIGGGPTGVELVSEMSDFFYRTLALLYRGSLCEPSVKIILVQKAHELLPQFPHALRAKSLATLKKKRIDVRLGCSVESVSKDAVVLSNGERLATATPVWVAGVKPALPRIDGIGDSVGGRLAVNEYLQVRDTQNMFALGDCAAYLPHNASAPLPALAQVATKQAICVADNIVSLIRQRPLKAFEYHSAGTLISLGSWVAAGEIANMTFFGKFAWWFWRTIYLMKLLSFPKKMRVALDWTFDLFLPRDISEL